MNIAIKRYEELYHGWLEATEHLDGHDCPNPPVEEFRQIVIMEMLGEINEKINEFESKFIRINL